MKPLIAAAAAAALLLAGCADDEPTTEPTDGMTSAAPTQAQATDSMEDKGVSFASPEDGAEVTSPVTLEFAATGLTIEAAGEVNLDAGHFHLFVDADCVAEGTVIGDEAQHFGDASTSTELELEPGEHTLCLQLADGAHTALPYTATITITVTA